ncbi:MAG: ribose 5-phosphate isomerase B [Dictyoglomus sp.]|nr:ribose 5-phosphate isomerase B [Dictyoglomus sp.]MDW8189323.1 ribose 5-phosphate isomerase B [Dictyoglomus sp.]
MKIVIGCDHAGFKLKKDILCILREELEFIDIGTNSEDPVDYPDIAEKACELIVKGEVNYGILICGTGIGMSIIANKFPGIRAALVYSDETAILAKKHNNANVICLGGRTMKIEEVIRWIRIWLNEDFEGGRHQRRIDKIKEIEIKYKYKIK